MHVLLEESAARNIMPPGEEKKRSGLVMFQYHPTGLFHIQASFPSQTLKAPFVSLELNSILIIII
jgi:hypothetical protein